MIDAPTWDDPFAPSSDPYLEVEHADELDGQRSPSSTITRRGVLKGLSVLSVVFVVPGCAPHRLGCLPKATNTEACQHRFCRYYDR